MGASVGFFFGNRDNMYMEKVFSCILKRPGFFACIIICTLFFSVSTYSADPRLDAVKDFLYVLQADHIRISDLADNDFDLVVMDYAKYGDEDSEYGPQEIQRIREGGDAGCTKIVLAYLSIGEAEDYRFYWETAWEIDPPAWLGPFNPDWPGNYKVRYWMEDWKAVIFGNPSGPRKSYLDRIIDQGFDGVYLDIIDAYEFWSETEGGNERLRDQARVDMKEFLREIRHYARHVRGRSDFLVFPQNAPDIILDELGFLDGIGRMFLDQCDGIGQEEIWYQGLDSKDKDEQDWVTDALDIFMQNGKAVLCVEYIWDSSASQTNTNKKRFNDFYTNALDKLYVPYAADKNQELNNIILVIRGEGFHFSQPVPNGKKGPIRR